MILVLRQAKGCCAVEVLLTESLRNNICLIRLHVSVYQGHGSIQQTFGSVYEV